MNEDKFADVISEASKVKDGGKIRFSRNSLLMHDKNSELSKES